MLLFIVLSILISACKNSAPTQKVEVSVDGGGEVVSDPVGIHCGNGNEQCSSDFSGSTEVRLIAKPQYLEYFEGWNGDCAEGGECVVDPVQGAKVSAKFTENLVSAASAPVDQQPVIPVLSHSLMNSRPGSVALRWRDPEDGFREETINGVAYKKTYEIYAALDETTLFSDSSLVASVENNEVSIEFEAKTNDPRCERRPPRRATKEIQGWGIYFNPSNLTCHSGLSGSRRKGNFRNEQEIEPNPKNPDAAERQEAISLCQSVCSVVGDPERFYVIDNLLENHRYYFGMVLVDRFGNRSSNIKLGNMFVGEGFSVRQDIALVDAVEEEFLSAQFTGDGASLRYVFTTQKNLGLAGSYIAVSGQDGYVEVFFITGVSLSQGIYTYTARRTSYEEWLDGDVVIKGSGYPAVMSNQNDIFQPKGAVYRAKSSDSVHVDCDAKGRAVMTRTDDPEWDQSPSFDYCIPLGKGNSLGCDDGGNELPRVVLSGNLRKKIGLKFDFQNGKCARREFELFSTKQKQFRLTPIKLGSTNRVAKIFSLQVSFGVGLEVEAETLGAASAKTDLVFSVEDIGISMRPTLNGISISKPRVSVTPIFESQLESYYTYTASVVPRVTITKDLVLDEATFDLKYRLNFNGKVKAQEISKVTSAGIGLAEFNLESTQGCAIDWAKEGVLKDISELFNIDIETEGRKCQEIAALPAVNHYTLPSRLSAALVSTGSPFSYVISKGNGFSFDSSSLRLGAYLLGGQNLVRHDALRSGSQISNSASRIDYQIPSMPAWDATFTQSTQAARGYQLYERAATTPLVLDDGTRIPGIPIVLNANHPVVPVVPSPEEGPPARRCGDPISAKGGHALEPQVFEIDMGQIAGRAQYEFEAYSIPDSFLIKSKSRNRIIYQSNGFVSGFHKNSFSFNPEVHGERLQLIVETNNPQTAWTFILGCPGETIESSQKPAKQVSLIVEIGRTAPGATNSCKLDFWLNGVHQYSGMQASLHRFVVRTHAGAFGGEARFRYALSDCTNHLHPFGGWDTSRVQHGFEVVPLVGREGRFAMQALK
jgi:hypothetical protein